MPSDLQIKSAETKYTNSLTGLYTTLLDLNVSMSSVAQQSTELMRLREGLLDMFGVAAASQAKPAKKPKQVQPKQPKEEVLDPSMAGQFRMKLFEVAAKRAGRQPVKDDFIFDTAFTVEGKTYMSTLTSSLLNKKGPYRGAAPEMTKKGAEQAACESALEAEFPDVYTEMKALGLGPDRGVKRRLTEDPIITNSKGKLSHAASLLFERTCTKEDLVYQVEECDGGFVSTVTVPYKGTKTFKGAVATNKKDAEANAAEACLLALKVPIAAATEAHREKKLKKRADAVAALEAKRAAEGQ